ncbi:NAD-dependent epimerase/dehydratase [Corchorus olitorius]|uniref:NAD-dependent epimerase/dehydratase n=1 Tax=Corchorus olitorius TaxID=93759 RepID=A0A1R3K796_9ROSI|nr:NAD-dependent epimerase/dehydratase [Corchorus olitorius]
MEKQATRKVCVTGGAGYLGSWLVKKLLDKGYTVHATLRNLEDKTKVGLLKSLPGADSKLVLFQADIYNPDEFKHAIQGCEFVFHMATPQQTPGSTQTSQEMIEAVVSGVRSIAESCIQSATVKRLIYTATSLAASPITKDGKLDFKSNINELCWTPVDITLTHGLDYIMTYTISKTLAEKEALSYNDKPNCKLEVVSLPLGLVGGETLLSYVPLSVQVMLSQLIGNSETFKALQFQQQLLGSILMVHIDDVCDAHIFCIEKPSMRGRFFCAAANSTITEIATYFRLNYPQYQITEEFMGEEMEAISCDRSKLVKMGFEYKYDMKNILDDGVKCGSRLLGADHVFMINQ